MLEARGQAYVLAVRSNHHLRFVTQEGLVETNPKTLANDLSIAYGGGVVYLLSGATRLH